MICRTFFFFSEVRWSDLISFSKIQITSSKCSPLRESVKNAQMLLLALILNWDFA